MPKRSDAEWKALGARIARDLMGCVKWEELTEEEQGAVKRWRVWRHYDGYWWQRGEGTPRLMCGILLWQPHLRVAQALVAADKICDQGWDRELTRLASGEKRYASFWKYRPVGPDEYSGVAETDAKAMSLAIEAWLDAQKELQDDSG